MSVYPHGELWPAQVRVAAAQIEQRSLTQGLAERSEQPPTTPAPPRQYLPRPAQRLNVYRAVALLASLLCAAAVFWLGLVVIESDLSLFAALATLAVFGFALSLAEVWALPSLYRWVYWRWLLVSWR